MAVATISVNFATPATVIAGSSYITSINPYSLFTALSSGNLYGLRLNALSANTFFGDGTNLTNIIHGINVANTGNYYAGVDIKYNGQTTGNVILSAQFVNDCPPWFVGLLNQPLLSATNVVLSNGLSARSSQQLLLSADVLKHVQYIVSQNPVVTGAEGFTRLTYTHAGGSEGCVVMFDGRVYISNTTQGTGNTPALIYNPDNDSYVTPTGNFAPAFSYSPVVLSDGRVFCSGQIFRIYNPSTDTLYTPPGFNTTILGAPGYATLLFDGRVFCSPHSRITCVIYDPVTNVISTPTGTCPPLGEGGAQLLLDGRVYCPPKSTTQKIAILYNPGTNSLSTPNGDYSGHGGYEGTVLMADGRVFCVPSGSTIARIYNPFNDTLITPSGTYSNNTQAYAGGKLLCDGRILCVPQNSNCIVLYDPARDVTTTPVIIPDWGESVVKRGDGAALLPNGKVFIQCYDPGTSHGIFHYAVNKPYSMNFVTSPLNNGF